jgi:NADH-quinone oxidoreductase subunit H
MIVIIYVGSFNLTTIVESQKFIWNIFILYPCFILFFVSALAETNRVPFDLPEAESELVSGYNVEYSAFTFALFFLAEYSNIILMSFLIVIFFFGGWLPLFSLNIFYFFFKEFWIIIKVLFVIYLFILVRGSLPRYRYDQLMSLGWKYFLPISLSYLLLYIILLFFNFYVF